MRAANFVDLTLTDDCHSRLCLAMVLGFVDPQPSIHRRAERLPFCPGIQGKCRVGSAVGDVDKRGHSPLLLIRHPPAGLTNDQIKLVCPSFAVPHPTSSPPSSCHQRTLLLQAHPQKTLQRCRKGNFFSCSKPPPLQTKISQKNTVRIHVSLIAKPVKR